MSRLSLSVLVIFNLAALHIKFLSSKMATDFEENECPHGCDCVSGGSSRSNIICSVSTLKDWEFTCRQLHDFASRRSALDLKIVGNPCVISGKFACLPRLRRLDMSNTSLIIQENTFQGLQIHDLLNISSNGIRHLPNGTFHDLYYLRELDLSHNSISKFEPGLFKELKSLKILRVGFNDLHMLSSESFSCIPGLEFLDLEANRIEEFTSLSIPHSGTLTSLNLRANVLQTIATDVNGTDLAFWKNMVSLDISENLLECSCALKHVYALMPNMNEILISPSATICASPERFKGQSIVRMKKTDLSCTAPNSIVSFPSASKDVLGTSSVTLQCVAKGYPKPSILWITPWNEWFFNGSRLQLSRHGLQPPENERIHTYREYHEPNVIMVSSIGLNSDNDLEIKKFRGSMSGNYTCLAFNIVGNTSLEINLQIFSLMKTVVIHSLFMGGYCACCFLIFGILVGVIRLLVVYLKQKLYFIVPMFSKAASAHDPEDNSTCHSLDVSLNKADSVDGSYEGSTPGSPLMAEGKELDSSDAEDKCDNTTEAHSSSSWLSYGIFDSLEEAKGRLRYGVGRKMERVRKNVQHMKESGSVYVQNIVESSSTAASRMRAGVVFGVEAVKYHVQSFKELCGTGDMGAQTISMVSVETNVDSQQQKEVIRQITFV